VDFHTELNFGCGLFQKSHNSSDLITTERYQQLIDLNHKPETS